MQTLDHDSVSLHMAAPADDVYALVADVTRMSDFSPEILSCQWLDGAQGPSVGARFVARNKVGRLSWRNRPVVTMVEPGRAFAFARTEKLAGTIEWSYRFEPDAQGTTVTESYQVTNPVTFLGWFMIGTLFRNTDRRGDLHTGMEQTLRCMRDIAEGSAKSSRGHAGNTATG